MVKMKEIIDLLEKHISLNFPYNGGKKDLLIQDGFGWLNNDIFISKLDKKVTYSINVEELENILVIKKEGSFKLSSIIYYYYYPKAKLYYSKTEKCLVFHINNCELHFDHDRR